MKSRLIIAVLCVGAVAYACGPRAHSDAASTTGSSTLATARSVTQQGTPRSNTSGAALMSSLVVAPQGGTLRFALEISNRGKKSVELSFPTGQTHDFAILDSLGGEVYRWGKGRLFTQALRNTMLSRGESLALSESWEAPALTPGTYVVVASLTSSNFPITERTAFTVTATTLATRD